MKQKDITLIAVVVIVSAVLSFVASRMIFSSPNNRHMQAEYVTPITTDFNGHLSDKYFNANSINPTQTINIGTDSNATPFNGQ
jgi:hypothetical protein